MFKPAKISFDDTIKVNKSKKTLKKTVWEYNVNKSLDMIDVARTSVSGQYPEEGWAGNNICTMIYYVLSGKAQLTLESGKSYFLKKADIFVLPPKTFYKVSGKFEALMMCSPAWYEEQTIKKL